MFLLDQADPAAVALHDASQGQTLTYRELANLVEAQRAVLGVAPKRLVFHFGRNDLPSLVWYLAAVDAGHAVALLDEALAPTLRQELVSLYEPDLIVHSNPGGQLSEQIPEGYSTIKTAMPGACALSRNEPASCQLNPDLALLLSTSGSTGSPKFVRLTRRNVLANAESISQALEITSGECAITSLPFYYSYGLSVINTHLLRGARLALTRESIISPGFWNAFRAAESTSFAGVPYTYEMLSRRIKLADLDLPTLRTMTQAGGKLTDKLVSEFHAEMERRQGRFYVMYGQTEAVARIAILPWDQLPQKLGSVGRAIPGGTIRIEGAASGSNGRDHQGELVYRGPNVMMGYATCRADLAKGDELQGELRTGDLGYLDANGFVYITGRMKRDAKLFGMRINLDEVEALLRRYTPSAAISIGDKLAVFCEGHGDVEELRIRLATTLRVHPSAFVFRNVDRLPLNANGKIDYGNLRDLA